MKSLASASVLLLLAACASAPPAPKTADARDCAVFAAVIRDRFPDGLKDGPALDDGRVKGDIRVGCDFSKAGLFVPNLYTDRAQGRFWFGPPEYRGATAKVRIGVQLAPMIGSGHRCELVREAGAWRVSACKAEWMT